MLFRSTFSVTPLILHTYQCASLAPAIPQGYQVELIGSNNITLIQEFWKDEYSLGTIGDFFDIQDFLHHGFGACVIHTESGLCVSACAAISVSKERCDFGLDTQPAHEGLGLATACSHAALGEALRRKKEPVWVTEYDNIGSQRVAQKIGFVKEKEFEVYKRLVVREKCESLITNY